MALTLPLAAAACNLPRPPQRQGLDGAGASSSSSSSSSSWRVSPHHGGDGRLLEPPSLGVRRRLGRRRGHGVAHDKGKRRLVLCVASPGPCFLGFGAVCHVLSSSSSSSFQQKRCAPWHGRRRTQRRRSQELGRGRVVLFFQRRQGEVAEVGVAQGFLGAHPVVGFVREETAKDVHAFDRGVRGGEQALEPRARLPGEEGHESLVLGVFFCVVHVVDLAQAFKDFGGRGAQDLFIFVEGRWVDGLDLYSPLSFFFFLPLSISYVQYRTVPCECGRVG